MKSTITEDELIKETLSSAKTIAMVGVSSIKKEETSNIKRRPSIIVMKYLQEFGYRVIPVNPFSVGKKAFYKQLEMPLKKAYKYTSATMTENMMALDAKEGISAFLEKRKPHWQNK